MWTALTVSGTGGYLLSAEAPFYTNVSEESGTGRPRKFAVGSRGSGGSDLFDGVRPGDAVLNLDSRADSMATIRTGNARLKTALVPGY